MYNPVVLPLLRQDGPNVLAAGLVVLPPRKNSKRVLAGALLVSPSFRKSKEPQLIPFYYFFRGKKRPEQTRLQRRAVETPADPSCPPIGLPIWYTCVYIYIYIYIII